MKKIVDIEFWNAYEPHLSTCKNHDNVFPEQMTKLWRDLILVLEDTTPPEWQALRSALLAVPLNSQNEFMTQATSPGYYGFRHGVNGQQGLLKNFGVLCQPDSNRISTLIAGQLYKNIGSETLHNYGVGTCWVEFNGQYRNCILISIDTSNKTNQATIKWIEPYSYIKDSDESADS